MGSDPVLHEDKTKDNRRMNKIRNIAWGVLMLLAQGLCAQVQVDVKIDSLQLFVGEQTGITLEVTCDADQKPQFPQYHSSLLEDDVDMLVPGVEVVETCKPDTTMLNNGKRMQISQKYIVTSFDSAMYYLPPMEVMVDTTTYKSNPLALKVICFDVDTLHVEQFAGIAGIEELEFSWEDWYQTIYASVAILLLAILIALAVWWLRQGNPVIPLMRRKPKLPPHQVAMQQIQRIKDDRSWATEDSKDYYTRLTDTLRTYIQDRYGFRAMDMTSSEIIERLTEDNNTEALAELTELFQTADLVKFAKHTTPINENDAHLLTAIQYIDQTKQDFDPSAQEKEPLYTAEQRKEIGMKWALRISIAVMSVAVVVLLVIMVIRLVDLLR